MSLGQKLKKQKEDFLAKAPPEVVRKMAAATEELRHSGLNDKVLRAGAQVPNFSLSNQDGETVGASELLLRGPLVLSFFRGRW